MNSFALESLTPDLIPAFLPRVLEPLVTKTLGFQELSETYAALRSENSDRPISERLLSHLRVTYRVAESDLSQVPVKGPAVVVANHPFGILEGAVLAALLRRIRPDVRFLANELLASIPELHDLVIPVDSMGRPDSVQRNGRGLRQALDFLAAGGMLVIFPAGEVSHFQWRNREASDSAWNPAVARIIASASKRSPSLPILPVYVDGSNSALFQVSGPKLRTAMLVRELLNKKGATIAVRIGKSIEAGAMLELPGPREQVDYLRWRTYLLKERQEFKPNTSRPAPWKRWTARPAKLIPPAADAGVLAAEVNALPPAQKLASSGDMAVYVASVHEIPAVLQEIGRLREITFREAGEGTGQAVDLDRFDNHYQHLFVWDAGRRDVVGAYRLAGTDAVRARFGVDGLYTATLFQFGDEFLNKLGPALELGRSFVRLEYQKGFTPLLLLWKGIGQFIARNPKYKVLFGPVTISNQYSQIARDLMVSFLERQPTLTPLLNLVRARRAPQRKSTPVLCRDVEQLSEVVSELEPQRWGVPVLLRQYLRLGGKLLGFNIDPNFSNALDGLILVDLTLTDRKLLERYLGKEEARRFLEFQKGHNGSH